MSGSAATAVKTSVRSSETTHGQVLRFIVVGGTNTVVSTAAFYALTFVLQARIAFTLVYVAGLVFTVIVTPRFVFGVRSSHRRRVVLALWYVAIYAVGIGVISVLEATVAPPRIVVVLGTVMVTAPLSFIGGRLLLARRR